MFAALQPPPPNKVDFVGNVSIGKSACACLYSFDICIHISYMFIIVNTHIYTYADHKVDLVDFVDMCTTRQGSFFRKGVGRRVQRINSRFNS